MQDETLLYEPSTVRFCALNPTAGFLWERLASPRSAADLLSELGAAFGIDDPAVEETHVQRFLDDLVHLSLLTPTDVSATSTDGIGAPAARVTPAEGYVTPQFRLIQESEVLEAFQVTSAGISWWVM